MTEAELAALVRAAYDQAIAPAYGLKWDQLEPSVQKNYLDVVRVALRISGQPSYGRNNA